MDWELLESWGIEKDSDPKKICEVLEERQLEFLQMRRNENDSAKKSEIAEELKKLEAQLKQAKKDAKKRPDSPGSNSVSTFSEPDASGDRQMAEMKKIAMNKILRCLFYLGSFLGLKMLKNLFFV